MPTISANSISEAWKQVVAACMRARGYEVSALTVEIACDDGPLDDQFFREKVSELLVSEDLGSVDTVSRTIFPAGLWNPSAPRSDLYTRYLNILPKLRRCNKRGIYFERLINYPSTRGGTIFTNQLEFIISTYTERQNHRRSRPSGEPVQPVL